MTDTVKIYDAKTNLSKLVDRAADGEEIIIAKPSKPIASYGTFRARYGQQLKTTPTTSLLLRTPFGKSRSDVQRAALRFGVDTARRFELEGAGAGHHRAFDAVARQEVAGAPCLVGGLGDCLPALLTPAQIWRRGGSECAVPNFS